MKYDKYKNLKYYKVKYYKIILNIINIEHMLNYFYNTENIK